MKLAMYKKDGRACFGAVVEGGFATLTGSLPALLGSGERPQPGPADTSLEAAEWLPFLVPGAKIFCAGLNYQAHAEEVGRTKPKPNVGFFMKVASALCAHGQPLRAPRMSSQFDYEGEVCVVIGRRGRHISVADAMHHVAGYTCLMDGSVRDYQTNSVGAGKNFEASGAVGPWMVTADEIPDPTRLTVTTRLNGEVVQHSGLDRLIHSIPRMIAYFSGITTLEPGDLIATGTPEGSGKSRTPPRWLQPGDVVEVDVSGVAVLSNPVAAEE